MGYDNPVAQNNPLLIPIFTNETDVFISQTLTKFGTFNMRTWHYFYDNILKMV
jgi:hypothetical protein